MLREGIIEESNSSWSYPFVKKDQLDSVWTIGNLMTSLRKIVTHSLELAINF